MTPYGIIRPQWVNTVKVEFCKLQVNYVNPMTTDTLAPCVTRAPIQYKDDILPV